MGYAREASKRRLGWRLIGGAALAVAVAIYAFLCAFGAGLDEDPTTSGLLATYVTFAALAGAAAMLLRGIVLVWQARQERKRSPAMECGRETKKSVGMALAGIAPFAVGFAVVAFLSGIGFLIDDDPTTSWLVNAAFAALVGAAVVVFAGIVLLSKAQIERNRSPSRAPSRSS